MKLRIFLVALILAAQVAGIFCVSRAREREWQNNPTFRLECRSYDPRDFLRGHYLPLQFKIEDEIPISKFDASAQKKLRKEYAHIPRSREFWVILAPNAETGLWEIERVTAEDPEIDFNANPQTGKIALKADDPYILPLRKNVDFLAPSATESAEKHTTQTAQSPEDFFTAGSPIEVKVRLDFPFTNRRFYLPEEKAKEFDKKFRGNTQHVISAELFFRADGSVVPKHLFIDGEEY
ncbi:MAG: GDYXXLXY domain-containing protein [Opitutales bacterium]|nr:GDYXXLXY domain-containing protein [Opitutales bacterium]